MPSIWFDPFPLTSLEAQVSGCPVVAFDQGGLREGIRHEETGLVVQDVSVEALITALDQLLSNPQRLAQMSQAALQWARDYFNWERVAREITTLCDTLAATTSFVTTGAEGAPNLARQVGVERDSNSLGCRTGSITKDALVCNQEIPKISVITVCYNHGEFIRDAIESVLAQDYPNLEHIVIDGGSSDQTVSILSEYKHLNWISEPDRGQSHALNKGFERASGDIIAWLNSDDWYAKGAFEAVVPALQAHPIVMGACQLTDRVGVPGEIVDNIPRDWFDILKYWVFNSIPAQPSIFFTRNL